MITRAFVATHTHVHRTLCSHTVHEVVQVFLVVWTPTMYLQTIGTTMLWYPIDAAATTTLAAAAGLLLLLLLLLAPVAEAAATPPTAPAAVAEPR